MSTEINIYSNKSSLILFWLLAYRDQIQKEGFSVNELARLTSTSIGLVHKVIKQLEYVGVVTSKGLRTNKKFYLKYPDKLLMDWVKEYNLIKKTKTKGFAFFDTKLITGKLDLVPALHTASVEYFKLKTTNLSLQEFYLLDWDKLPNISSQLKFVELDRGYEVLLIKPYYLTLIERVSNEAQKAKWIKPYALLTVLDLLHFPVRGLEQAETLFRKTDYIKSICSWSEIENAIR